MNEKECWFISHTTRDRSVVNELVEILKSCEIPYWIAPEMIPKGSCYAQEIPPAIHSCSVFLLVLSENSQDSIYVQREVDMAVGYHKKILSLKIDKEPLTDMFHFWLNTVQMQDVEVQSNNTLSWETKATLRMLFLQEVGKDIHFNKSTTTFEETKSMAKMPNDRTNALRVNKVPTVCEYCGGNLQHGALGAYICSRCGREYYDDFRKIRNFLETNGSATAWEISKCTGVTMSTVKEYFSDGPKFRGRLGEGLNRKGVWHTRRE